MQAVTAVCTPRGKNKAMKPAQDFTLRYNEHWIQLAQDRVQLTASSGYSNEHHGSITSRGIS
jgi:hypothetical protein